MKAPKALNCPMICQIPPVKIPNTGEYVSMSLPMIILVFTAYAYYTINNYTGVRYRRQQKAAAILLKYLGKVLLDNKFGHPFYQKGIRV